MTDNKTVTISADYFAKLHRLANEMESMQMIKTGERTDSMQRINEKECGEK